MRLFVTGKISVARAIALALSSRQQPFERANGYFRIADDYVTWTGGHLLELAEPENYDKSYEHWRLDALPIIPRHSNNGEWKYLERETRGHQLSLIRNLLAQADKVIHAGDPDREGQWMVDEVLEYLQNSLTVQRLLIHDLNTHALRKALHAMDRSPLDNNDFKSLSVSARARSHADWLYGINMTRAYTLLGRHSGYEGVLSVGRVQTPLLALVTQRDEAIEQFIAQNYFEMQAKFRHEADLAFLNATIAKAEFCYANWNRNRESGLVLDEKFYEPITQKIRGKFGLLTVREEQHHSVTAPLPLNLSTLQIECALRFGYSATEVAENCHELYEEYQLITYPRSECRYLPESLVDEVNDVLDSMRKNLPATEKSLKEKINSADSWRRSSCWDNKKIKSHHAIIPTVNSVDSKLLSEQQIHIYQVICRYYLAQFFGDRLSAETTLGIVVEGEEFYVSRVHVTEAGWQDVVAEESNDAPGTADTGHYELPPWQPGDRILCEDVDIRAKKTRPPLRFTDASLLEAMSAITPFIQNKDLLPDLHDLDGLGTESTRASTIDTLFKREYLMKGSKNIFSTPLGRDLVHALPVQATQVDMTARWEKMLQQIAEMPCTDAERASEQFMRDVEKQVTLFVEHARHKKNMALTSTDKILGIATAEKFHCPKCQSLLVQRHGKNGVFWGCSSYPDCKGTVPDFVNKEGKHLPDFTVRAGNAAYADILKPVLKNSLDKNCPDCGKPLVKRKGKRGVFAGCSGYPACTHTEPLLLL